MKTNLTQFEQFVFQESDGLDVRLQRIKACFMNNENRNESRK